MLQTRKSQRAINDNFDSEGYDSLRLTIQACVDGKIAVHPDVIPMLFEVLRDMRPPVPPESVQRAYQPANDAPPVSAGIVKHVTLWE